MLNIAIIGTGAIAPAHIQAYQQFSDRCQIVALCDIYPEKAEQAAKQFGLHVELYEDYKQLLKRADIDLISICTPPYTHAEIAIAGLNAGKHVLVEKPMASSLEECDAMNAAATNNQKKAFRRRSKPLPNSDDESKASARIAIGRSDCAYASRFILVEGIQLLRFMVAWDVGKGGRWLYIKSCRAPYRHFSMDEWDAC